MPPLNCIYRDRHLLVVNKPSGLPTMGVGDDQPSLLQQVHEHLETSCRSEATFAGFPSRLDAPTSGLVAIALDRSTAAYLSENWHQASFRKIYWAIVQPPPTVAAGECADWLISDARHRRMNVVTASHAGAQEARLTYRTLWQGNTRAILQVEIQTGRKHQIRVQLAQRGFPIHGDLKYGGDRLPRRHRIGLHCRRLQFPDLNGRLFDFTAPCPSWWDSVEEFAALEDDVGENHA